LAGGAVCNWLLSQAFFVVEVDLADNPTDLTQRSLEFYITHSPEAIGIGTLVVIVGLIGLIIYLFVGQWTWMPVMNGSVRVVLAPRMKLILFPEGGIGWGDSSDDNERVAGFGGSVGSLVEGEIYPVPLCEEKIAEMTQNVEPVQKS
jgi:hypothetical protein